MKILNVKLISGSSKSYYEVKGKCPKAFKETNDCYFNYNESKHFNKQSLLRLAKNEGYNRVVINYVRKPKEIIDL